MVGDEQRAAFERDVLEALPLGAQPVAVDGFVEGAGERAHGLAPAPRVDAQQLFERRLVERLVGGGHDRGRQRAVGADESEGLLG